MESCWENLWNEMATETKIDTKTEQKAVGKLGWFELGQKRIANLG